MAETAVRLDGLTKHFGRQVALDALTLSVEKGLVVGLLGPNGAGKSTTLRLLLGLIQPTAGSAEILGHAAGSMEARRSLAYVPGEVMLWPKLSGMACLEVFANLHGEVDVELRNNLIERFALDPTKRAGAYSKGNRQKVALIAALSSRAPLLVFDEPTSGLDPLMEQVFRSEVHNATSRGQTVLLSSHLLGEVQQLCSHVAMLRDGRLLKQARLDELTGLLATTWTITFDGAPPGLDGLDGVTILSSRTGELVLSVTGPVPPLLRAIEGICVTSLTSREASLEEIFLNLYDEVETHQP